MSKYLTITIFSTLLIFLILPQVASAAVLPFNFGQDSLVPCGRCHEWECIKWKMIEGKNVCVLRNHDKCIDPPPGGVGDPCNLCHFFVLVQNVINIFVSLIILVAPVILMFGGFMILSSAGIPERVSYGKRVLTYAVIALLITFGAWTIINTVLVTAAGNMEVDGQKVGKIHGFKYPWNKIKCYVPPPSDGGNGVVENKICCCDLEGLKFKCKTYTSQSGCSANCEDYCKGQLAFADCCVDTEKRCGPPSLIGQKYCVCETPRYASMAGPDPLAGAPVIGTDMRVTELPSGGECNQKCVSGDFKKYCSSPIRYLPANKYHLYCAAQSFVEGKQVCGMHVADEYAGQGCRIGNECYSSDDECLNAATTTYQKKCFLDGLDLCSYYTRGGSTFCPKATSISAGYCGGDSSKYILIRWQKEDPSGTTYNAYDCSRYTYDKDTSYYCRLNCQYETCK